MLKTLNNIFRNPSERTVCYVKNKHISESQFCSDVEATIGLIKAYKNENCLICIDNPYHFLVALLALLSQKTNAIISANRTEKWLNTIRSDFDFILCDSDFVSRESVKFEIIMINDLFYENESRSKNENYKSNIHFSGDEPLSFFTSGSTGKAKKIDKTLGYLTNEVETLNKEFGTISVKARFISSVSHLHIYGLLFYLLFPLLTRRSWNNSLIEFQEQLSVSLSSDKQNVLISSPAFLSRLDEQQIINGLEHVFSSGGLLSKYASCLTRIVLRCTPIEVYGSTESGGIAFRQQHGEHQAWSLFEKINLLAYGDDIELTSPHIGAGNTLILDDYIEFVGHNQIMLLGRKDRIVKIGEKRVSLDEIESFIMGIDYIDQCRAVLLSGKRPQVGCVIILSNQGVKFLDLNGRKELTEHLKSQMRLRFEATTLPRKWRIVANFPMNSQSKVDIISLEALFHTS